MKIVILGTAYPYRGGLATFTERLARQFQDEGNEVEVITFTLQYPSFLFPGKTQYTTDPAPKDLHITRQLNSCNPFNWLRVGRMLRKQQPDLVICCYWMAFFAPMFGTICRLVHHSINSSIHHFINCCHSSLDSIQRAAGYTSGIAGSFATRVQPRVTDTLHRLGVTYDAYGTAAAALNA